MKMTRVKAVMMGLALSILAGTSSGRLSADHALPKLDRALTDTVERGDASRVHILISVRPGTAEDMRRRLIAAAPRNTVTLSSSPDLLVAELAAADLPQLARQEDVVRVSSDAPVTSLDNALLAQNTLLGTEGLLATQCSATPYRSPSYTGQERDRGADRLRLHAERRPATTSSSFDFTRGGVPLPPSDDYGHGTHVAGLIGSDGGYSSGQYAGRRAGRPLCRAEGARRKRRRLTSNVIDAINFAVSQEDSSASTSSTSRSATRFTSARPPTRSCARSRTRPPPASSSWRRPATSAATR